MTSRLSERRLGEDQTAWTWTPGSGDQSGDMECHQFQGDLGEGEEAELLLDSIERVPEVVRDKLKNGHKEEKGLEADKASARQKPQELIGETDKSEIKERDGILRAGKTGEKLGLKLPSSTG